MLSRHPLAFALLAAALAAPASARAQLACSIEASGDDSAEWSAATGSLHELVLTDRDCVSVRIDITADHARVVFTTADGRSAERIVTTPSDLRPTVNALRVQAPDAPASPSEPAAKPVTRPSPPAVRAAPRPVDSRDLRLALLTGLRGGADYLLSPVLSADLGLGFGLLELGASLAAEVQYFDMAAMRSPDRQGGAAALGLAAGVRHPEGSFDLRAGARAALAFLITANHASQSCPFGEMCPFPGEDEHISEWRLGAYGGFAVPRSSAFRFRLDAAVEIATVDPSADTLPLTPWLALSTLVGLEVAP